MYELTGLQTEVLRRFFERRREFFLTGGAALVGFYLHHRETHDLDLFTPSEGIDAGERTLEEIASDLGAALRNVQRSPTFRRFLLVRGEEGLIVDLARDDAPQVSEKNVLGGIVVDSPEEILVNKLCSLLSRVEVRDLVDVARLAQAGHDVIAAVELAKRKDAGMAASQLAWVLSSFPIPPDSVIHGMPRQELETFRTTLIRRLTEVAFPG